MGITDNMKGLLPQGPPAPADLAKCIDEANRTQEYLSHITRHGIRKVEHAIGECNAKRTGGTGATLKEFDQFYRSLNHLDNMVLEASPEKQFERSKAKRTPEDEKEFPYFGAEGSFKISKEDWAKAQAPGKMAKFLTSHQSLNPVRHTIAVLEAKQEALHAQLAKTNLNEWTDDDKRKAGLVDQNNNIDDAAFDKLRANLVTVNAMLKAKAQAKENSLSERMDKLDKSVKALSPVEQATRIIQLKTGQGQMSKYDVPDSIMRSGVQFKMGGDPKNPSVTAFRIPSSFMTFPSIFGYDAMPGARFAAAYYKNIMDSAEGDISPQDAFEKTMNIKNINTAGNPTDLLRFLASATAAAKLMGAKAIVDAKNVSGMSSTDATVFEQEHARYFPQYEQEATQALNKLVAEEVEKLGLPKDNAEREKNGKPTDRDILGQILIGSRWQQKTHEQEALVKSKETVTDQQAGLTVGNNSEPVTTPKGPK